MPTLKIAICVPCYGDPKALFMQSLFDATRHFLQAKLTDENGEEYEKDLKLFVVRSSMLTEGRHRLAAEALNWGADYMLWCDADHTFQEDAICRLWSRGVMIVGANYPRRCIPTAPTAAKIVEDDPEKDHRNLVYTTKEKSDDDVVEEVSHLGFGLCLINMKLYDYLQLQAEKEGKTSFLPLFAFTPSEDHKSMIGEDVFFFRKCKDAGVKVFCDHSVSWRVGHIHEIALTNGDALRQEPEWTKKTKALADKYKQRIDELEAAE
ncbi:MAG: hypothetical protein E6Q77_04040 [Rhizobium sp.]|nr:MAG: hypothetical protein E6Q77_04040 [Rhizobium sp.]